MAVSWENQLTQILEKERSLLDQICKCSKEKTGLLAKGDVDGISKIVSKEQTLSLLMQAAEKKRLSLIRENRLSGRTLREICALADSENKDILESQLQSLCNSIQELKKTNDFNNELTKTRLEFYGKLRALYSQSVYGYSKEVKAEVPHESGIIDRSV